jgi:LysR family transcriptional regulator, benzoate and cis,cis-muconate-responsive activator of ben and cat genes
MEWSSVICVISSPSPRSGTSPGPPLSRQVHDLEAELGIALLDRDCRPVRLTEAGRLFYEHATQVLERIDDLRTMMRRFRDAERPRFVIGFVASTIYAALPNNLIRRFRAATPGLDVLREERLVVALPLSHLLLERDGPLSFADLAGEQLILYPRVPRPSYADQVIPIFRDRGLEPRIAHEARELQTAIGLVAAEVGICIVPTSVQRLRRDDVVYRELVEQIITSPIIMSRRANDRSHELAVMSRVINEACREWGWKTPEGLDAWPSSFRQSGVDEPSSLCHRGLQLVRRRKAAS